MADEAPARKQFTYTGIDGNEHGIEVYSPADHQTDHRRPCYIFFHGGGWKSGSLNQGKPFCEYLSSRGMVAVTADYSMHPKQEKGKLDLGNPKRNNSTRAPADGESRKRICVIDGKSVIRWAKSHADELGIDPEKIIVSGASAGAHISVLATADKTYNNPSDPEGVDTRAAALVLLSAAITQPKGEELYDVSAFHHVDKKFPPVLFIYGEKDRWTEGGIPFAKRLKENGNSVEVWYGPDQNHMFFRGEGWYPPTFLLIDRFLRDHGLLEGEPTLKLGPKNGKLIPWDVL